jgi:hypothetical protein
MKRSKEQKTKLSKKLKSYTTIALSAIAADASSQVIYTDIRDTTLINNGDFFDIDLNNDGINDLNITLSKSIYSSTYSSYSIYVNYNSVNANASSNNQVNTLLNTSYSINEAFAFNNNQNINSSANSWNSYGIVGGFATGSIVNPYSTSYLNINIGQFPGQGDRFLGVRFRIGANTHYGWVRLDVSAFSDSVTIKDFAFDTTANTPILAGDTGVAVGISELNEKGIKLYAQQNRLYFQEIMEQTAEIKIFDLKGQLMERRRLIANQSELQLSKEYQGIYIVEVNQGKSVFRKKLWLESH